jgi:hypothetical protein
MPLAGLRNSSAAPAFQTGRVQIVKLNDPFKFCIYSLEPPILLLIRESDFILAPLYNTCLGYYYTMPGKFGPIEADRQQP